MSQSPQQQPDTASSGGSSGRKKRRVHHNLRPPEAIVSIEEMDSSSDRDLDVEGVGEGEGGHQPLIPSTQVCRLHPVASFEYAVEDEAAWPDQMVTYDGDTPCGMLSCMASLATSVHLPCHRFVRSGFGIRYRDLAFEAWACTLSNGCNL